MLPASRTCVDFFVLFCFLFVFRLRYGFHSRVIGACPVTAECCVGATGCRNCKNSYNYFVSLPTRPLLQQPHLLGVVG